MLDGMQHVNFICTINWVHDELCSARSTYDGISSYFAALNSKLYLLRWLHSITKDSAHARVLIDVIVLCWPSKAKHTHQPLLGFVMLPWKFTIHGLSTPRALCLRTDQSFKTLDPWSRIILIGFLDVEEVHWLAFFSVGFGRERVNDCNLGVLGVELSSFI